MRAARVGAGVSADLRGAGIDTVVTFGSPVDTRGALPLGIPEERCAVVLPPLDTERFHPPGAPVEEPIAVFVSPLAENNFGLGGVLVALALCGGGGFVGGDVGGDLREGFGRFVAG